MSVELKHIDTNDKSQAAMIKAWFKDDAYGSDKVGFYANTAKWYALFNANRYGLVVLSDGRPAGLIDVEIEKGTCAHIAYYIAPHFRNQGLGKGALLDFESLIRSDQNITSIRASVDPGNTASRALLESIGYKAGEIDKEKMIPYKKFV